MMSFKKESSACTSGQCRGHLPTGEVVVSEVVDQKDTPTPLDLREIGAHQHTLMGKVTQWDGPFLHIDQSGSTYTLPPEQPSPSGLITLSRAVSEVSKS